LILKKKEDPTIPYVKLYEISIYFEVHGNNGSPLLMINGLGCSIATWSPELLRLLSTQHRVVIFDNRGVGQSDKPTTPFKMADFASDAVGILDDLQMDRAHVFGVSMGGMIAQHVAVNYPTRVQSLILTSTSSVWDHPKFVPPTQEVLMQFAKPALVDPVQDMRDGWWISYPPAYIESHRDWLEQGLQKSLASVYPETPNYARELQMGAVLSSHNTYDKLSQIICPTLVQTGTEDILIPPENSRMLAERIPNARWIEYPGYGHDMLGPCEEKATQDILGFVAENE
jgi:3-oxoadipate enol-lactonase